MDLAQINDVDELLFKIASDSLNCFNGTIINIIKTHPDAVKVRGRGKTIQFTKIAELLLQSFSNCDSKNRALVQALIPRIRSIHDRFLALIKNKSRQVKNFISFPESVIGSLVFYSDQQLYARIHDVKKNNKLLVSFWNFGETESTSADCIPHTGRTHQIRVHLQYFGYPIVNDVFYNNIAWGPNKAKDGIYEVPHEKVCERILAEHNATLWDGGPNPFYQQKLEEMKLQKSQASSLPDSAKQSINPSDLTEVKFEEASGTSVGANILKQSQISDEPPHKRRKEEENTQRTSTTFVENLADGGKAPCFDMAKLTVDESCEMCKKKTIDPEEKDLVMFLHALKYGGPGWAYETDLPDWAREDWDKDSEYVRKEWCSLKSDEEPSLL